MLLLLTGRIFYTVYIKLLQLVSFAGPNFSVSAPEQAETNAFLMTYLHPLDSLS